MRSMYVRPPDRHTSMILHLGSYFAFAVCPWEFYRAVSVPRGYAIGGVDISLRDLRGQPLQLPVKVKLERTFLILHLGALAVRVGLLERPPTSPSAFARTTPNKNGEGAR